MVTLSVLLWLVFLIEAFARVSADAWVFRPGTGRPLQRGGDLTLTSIGELVWLPLVPWSRIAVVDQPTVQRFDRTLETLDDGHLRALRWSGGVLSLLLLFVLPGLAVRSAFAPWALAWGACAGAALMTTVVLYGVLRRRWHVAGAPAPWTLVISPVSAIHAAHTLSRHLFATADPVDVASHVLDGDDLLKAGRQMWWDLPDRRASLEAMLSARGVVGGLHQAPAPDAQDVHHYCPRCLAQYIEGPVECRDCAGIALVTFGNQAH